MTMKEIRPSAPEPTRVRREVEFPVAIEGRMEAILSSLNSGPKAVVMLTLRESITDTSSLNGLFREISRRSVMPIKNDIAESYARNSLCRIGLVAEEAVIDYYGKEKSVGFATTRAGRTYGASAAAFILDFERKNNFSVYGIFGQTGLARGDRRAPLTRAKIINYLYEEGGRRQIDIAQALGTNHERIRSSLVALKKSGIVDSTSLTPQTGLRQVTFSVNQEMLHEPAQRVVKQNQEFSDKVLEIARLLASKGQTISQKSVFAQIRESYGHLSEVTLGVKISKTLSYFADKQGVLIRDRFRGKEVQSDVKLTEKGKFVATEFLKPLSELLSSEESETLARVRTTILPQVQADLDTYATHAIDLYYPHSRSFSAKNREDVKSAISSALEESGKTGVTSQHLGEALSLGELKTRRILLAMVASGMAKRELRNGVFYYSVK